MDTAGQNSSYNNGRNNSKKIEIDVDGTGNIYLEYPMFDTPLLLSLMGRLTELGKQIEIDRVNAELQLRITINYSEGAIPMVSKFINNNN